MDANLFTTFGTQGTRRKHSGNAGKILGTLWEHAGNILGKFSQHSADLANFFDGQRANRRTNLTCCLCCVHFAVFRAQEHGRLLVGLADAFLVVVRRMWRMWRIRRIRSAYAGMAIEHWERPEAPNEAG
jgi:hypothetical protein